MKIVINAWRDTVHPLAGGSELYVDRVLEGLIERGHDITLFCGGPTTRHPYEAIDTGGKFTHYLRTPLAHARYARHADLVVDVANGMSYYSAIWRRTPTVCLVHHVHTEQWDQWFGPVLTRLGKGLESRATPWAYRKSLFATVSPSTAGALERLGVDRRRIRFVPNGVDLPETVGAKSSEPTFVSVGRLSPHKRYDLMMELWPEVRARTGGRLVVVGDGPQMGLLKSMAGDGVEFVGRVSDAHKNELLSEAWALIHPSMLEGWGLSVMEAAAHATPTIGYWVPGIRDSVVDGQTGLLADTDEEFVANWVAAGTDLNLRSKLGEMALRRAGEFSWTATVDRFEDLAREAVGAHDEIGSHHSWEPHLG